MCSTLIMTKKLKNIKLSGLKSSLCQQVERQKKSHWVFWMVFQSLSFPGKQLKTTGDSFCTRGRRLNFSLMTQLSIEGEYIHSLEWLSVSGGLNVQLLKFIHWFGSNSIIFDGGNIFWFHLDVLWLLSFSSQLFNNSFLMAYLLLK